MAATAPTKKTAVVTARPIVKLTPPKPAAAVKVSAAVKGKAVAKTSVAAVKAAPVVRAPVGVSAKPPSQPSVLDQIGSFIQSHVDQATGKTPSPISQAMKNPPQWYQKP